ncbi:MAG: universal stress protein [Candidatus Verstraetearchaeota archaeon]|nr:universal stress protein [Candidatus Verstraetearchaeota archaeon]
MISKILVIADGSAVSEQALIEAIHIGKIFNSTIICIHPMPRHDAVQVKAGKEIIDRYEAMVRGAGLAFEWLFVEDQPGPAAVKVAERRGVDLIVVGSLGEKGIKRKLIPSAPEYIVKNAGCDVYVVKKREPLF